MKVELPGDVGTVETPRGGCSNEARKKLYGDPETWFVARRTVTGMMPLYVPDVMKDERFTVSLKKWSRCMAAAGRPFANPDKLREQRDLLTAHPVRNGHLHLLADSLLQPVLNEQSDDERRNQEDEIEAEHVPESYLRLPLSAPSASGTRDAHGSSLVFLK